MKYCRRCGYVLAECGCGWPAEFAKERRERIATAVLSGFAALSSGSRMAEDLIPLPAFAAAMAAVRWADALIAELDK